MRIHYVIGFGLDSGGDYYLQTEDPQTIESCESEDSWQCDFMRTRVCVCDTQRNRDSCQP